MDFKHDNLVNGSNYLEQKINLQSDKIDPETKVNGEQFRLYLIPTFTIVGFPIANVQQTANYYLQFNIVGFYLKQFPGKSFFNTRITIDNIIFQYDLNYSATPGARGQIAIGPFGLYFNINNKNFSNNSYTFDIGQKIINVNYKILLPVKAIKKNGINTLNYSFNAKNTANHTSWLGNDYWKTADNNYGSVSFSFNENPQYQLQIIPAMFTNKNFILAIKNPIILQTNITLDKDNDFKALDKPNLSNLVVGSIAAVNEIFEISGNNINTISTIPLKVKRYFALADVTKPYNAKILQEILAFHNNFTLEQNTTLINDDDNKFYTSNKTPARLVADHCLNPEPDLINRKEEYHLEFDSNLYDEKTNKINLNQEGLKNQFNLPWFDNFAFHINIPLTFQTFFKYDIVLKLIEKSESSIIGEYDSLISIQKVAKDQQAKWVKSTNIILTYDEILRFYSSHNFTFADYQHLNKKIVV